MNHYAIITEDNRVLDVFTSEHDAGHRDVVDEGSRRAESEGATWVYVEEPCQVGDTLDVDADGCATVRREETAPDAAALKRAADHIDATELPDGRWAHYADETSRWYVVTADELAELAEYLDSDDEQVSRDAYSHWCAGTSGKEMPRDWSPESAA